MGMEVEVIDDDDRLFFRLCFAGFGFPIGVTREVTCWKWLFRPAISECVPEDLAWMGGSGHFFPFPFLRSRRSVLCKWS